MNKDDTVAFVLQWNAIREIYGHKKQTPQAVSLCFHSLKTYSLRDIFRALDAHVKCADNEFPPKPSNIIKFFEGDSEFKANKAWDLAWRSVSTIGAWRSVSFEDEIIMKVIEDLGSWIKFCNAKLSEESFLRREFTTRYKGYMSKKPDGQMIPRMFPGLPQMKDDKNNKHKVLLIGERQTNPKEHFNHKGVRVLTAITEDPPVYKIENKPVYEIENKSTH